MGKWSLIAVAGAGVMQAASHHFSGGGKGNKNAAGGNVSGSSSGGSVAAPGTWWNPQTPIETSVTGSAAPGDRPVAHPAESSGSIIPVDHGAQFGSSSLNLGGSVRIGSNSSQEAYAILGLGTRSTPASSTSLISANNSVSTGFSGGKLVAHFSLAGDLNLVPTDNLAAGGLSGVTLAAVPEPSTAGLLGFGLAGLGLVRRRKASPAS